MDFLNPLIQLIDIRRSRLDDRLYIPTVDDNEELYNELNRIVKLWGESDRGKNSPERERTFKETINLSADLIVCTVRRRLFKGDRSFSNLINLADIKYIHSEWQSVGVIRSNLTGCDGHVISHFGYKKLLLV